MKHYTLNKQEPAQSNRILPRPYLSLDSDPDYNKKTNKLKLTSTRTIKVVLWVTAANEVITLPPFLA